MNNETTTLTEKETTVLTALRGEQYEDEVDGFGMVYLDNAINTTDKTVRGVLGSLTKKGLYQEEDGFAWGWVKI